MTTAGRPGNLNLWLEDRYAERVFDRQNTRIYNACRRLGLPLPQIEKLWNDLPGLSPDVDWWDVHEALGLDFEAEMGWCRGVSLSRVAWPETARMPALMLVAVTSIEVTEHTLQLVASHHRDLRDHRVLILVYGTGFSGELAARGGPAAVARAGAHFVERPLDWDTRADEEKWRDLSVITAALQAWVADHQTTTGETDDD